MKWLRAAAFCSVVYALCAMIDMVCCALVERLEVEQSSKGVRYGVICSY